MGFSASNFSASTPWLVIIMLDLDFFWVDVSWLFALTQWLGEGEIASREIEDDMFQS